MFEQASYNLAFSLPMATPSLAIAQTRALMTAVAPPLQFNKKKHESFPAPQSVYTTWINLAAHHSNRYYFYQLSCWQWWLPKGSSRSKPTYESTSYGTRY